MSEKEQELQEKKIAQLSQLIKLFERMVALQILQAKLMALEARSRKLITETGYEDLIKVIQEI